MESRVSELGFMDILSRGRALGSPTGVSRGKNDQRCHHYISSVGPGIEARNGISDVQTKLIVGIDEAGYGPSMGPLTIAATAWRVPIDCELTKMGELLAPEIQPRPLSKADTHVPIGDSKKVNSGPRAAESLSTGASFLLWLSQSASLESDAPMDFSSALSHLAPQDSTRVLAQDWYRSEVAEEENGRNWNLNLFEPCVKKLHQNLITMAGVELRVFDEIEFNRIVAATGNKSTLLSEASLLLSKVLVERVCVDREPIEIYCDKHGGRNKYHGLVSHFFDNEWFTTLDEGTRLSRYQANWKQRSLSIQFAVGGDAFFPTSAASILAKWTREQLMARLNTFWASKFSGPLTPTAGYYVDAVRFANEIESLANKLGFSKSQWWRSR
jgi:ribonuclease HII